jgi:ATP-binding cassette, subfamily B, bacterial PglK
MRSHLLTLYKGLSKKNQTKLFLLLAFMLIGMGFELLSIALVIPFLALISDISSLENYEALSDILGFLQDNSSLGIIFLMTLVFVIFSILNGLIRVALLRANLAYIYNVGADIGLNVFKKIITQSLTFHTQNNSSITLGATRKVDYVVDTIIKPLLQGIVSSLFAVGITVLMIIVAPTATAIFAGTALTYYFIITLMFKARLNDMSRIIAGNETNRINAVQESLGSIRDVIVDKKHQYFIDRFDKENFELRKLQASTTFLILSPRLVLESIGVSAIAVAGYVSTTGDGSITEALPLLGLIAISAQKLLPLLQQVYGSWSSIHGSLYLLSEVVEILELPEGTSRDREGGRKEEFRQVISKPADPDKEKPLIRVEDLEFRYPGSDKNVLNGVSLNISRGESIGLIGETGSGKSTLIDLIMGLDFNFQGKIAINGILLNKDSCSDWHDMLSHVPQSIYLLDATIAENIALGEERELLNYDRILAAAKKAKLDDFVARLDFGYDTRVGERGVKLSGGQRQRIGIARALYKGADVLVFDEATSALDSKTEQLLIDDIASLKGDVTIVMVAHRLTTLASCDRIIELKNGVVFWAGNYSNLTHRE